jgi:dolichol-phosphate mannosyltransferase
MEFFSVSSLLIRFFDFAYALSYTIKMKDIIVVPTYNEKNNITMIISRIFQAVPHVHIVVVDDNSPDGTADEVRRIIKTYDNRVRLFERKSKEGLGAAYKDILSRLAKDSEISSVVTMDADGSHDPIYLPVLFEQARFADLVIGSRYVERGGVKNWERWRMYLSRFGNLYSRVLTGVGINDLTAGFVCMKGDLLRKIDFSQLGSSGYSYQIEFKTYCVSEIGATYKEIPIIFKNRIGGESKLSKHIIFEGIKAPLGIFLRRMAK